MLRELESLVVKELGVEPEYSVEVIGGARDYGVRARGYGVTMVFNNVKPKDWYFVLDLVQFRTGLGYERLIM